MTKNGMRESLPIQNS